MNVYYLVYTIFNEYKRSDQTILFSGHKGVKISIFRVFVNLLAYLQIIWFEILVCGLFADNVVSFADNVVLRGVLFAVNLVSKLSCLRFEAILFAVPYT